MGPWSSPPPRPNGGYDELVRGRRDGASSASTSTACSRRSSRTRTRPTSTPTPATVLVELRRGGPRDRRDHRSAGPPGAGAGRASTIVGDDDRRPRQGALRLRAVRQRALVLHPAPRGLAAAARRAGDVRARPARRCCAGLDAGEALRRGEGARRRRPHPAAGRPAGRPRPAAASRSRELAEQHDLVLEPGPQRDRGPLAGMDKGRPSARWWRSRTPRGSSSPATTSATSTRSRRSPSCGSRAGHAAGLLAVRRRRTPSPSSPTSSSRAPRACWSCCAELTSRAALERDGVADPHPPSGTRGHMVRRAA